MVKSSLFIPRKIYQNIYDYLFPKGVYFQSVAFIFAGIFKASDSLEFQFNSWYPTKSCEYKCRCKEYVELQDMMRQKIIKRAFDLDAAIIELHSHVCLKGARFSPTDLQGFKEFVPHVWWRLNKKPYAAVVFSKSDFDAFVWVDDPEQYLQLTEIVVNGRHLCPTGLTLANIEKRHGHWTF